MNQANVRQLDDTNTRDDVATVWLAYVAWRERNGLAENDAAAAAFAAGYLEGRVDTLTLVAPDAVTATLAEPEADA